MLWAILLTGSLTIKTTLTHLLTLLVLPRQLSERGLFQRLGYHGKTS